MNKKTDDRRVRKTKRVLRQALAEILKTKSLKDVTVRELTDLADLHRGTFYIHYKDIYDLYEQIEIETLNEVRAILDNTVMEPYQLIYALLKYMEENAALFQMLLGENGDTSFMRQLTDIIQEKCTAHLVELFPNTPHPILDAYACYVMSGCMGVVRRWSENGMINQPKQVALLLDQMAKNGFNLLKENTIKK